MLFNSGGMLTGAEIERQIRKGNIAINPYNADQLNPNSYNMKLHPKLLVYKRNSYNNRGNIRPHTDLESVKTKQASFEGFDDIIAVENSFDTIHNYPIIESCTLDPLDALKDNETVSFNIPKEGYVLQPGVLYIGRTVETTATDKYIPMINGRSSGGRLGISIHICAGFGDIGFDGTWTLEITCVEPVRIYPHMEIAQVCFFKPEGKIKNLYRGRYYRQEEPTPSRMWKGKITG